MQGLYDEKEVLIFTIITAVVGVALGLTLGIMLSRDSVEERAAVLLMAPSDFEVCDRTDYRALTTALRKGPLVVENVEAKGDCEVFRLRYSDEVGPLVLPAPPSLELEEKP